MPADRRRLMDHLAVPGKTTITRPAQAASCPVILAQIGQVLSLLKRFPHIGHDGHRPGTFELLVPRLPVVIVYRIDVGDREEMIVLRVYHTRQQR